MVIFLLKGDSHLFNKKILNKKVLNKKLQRKPPPRKGDSPSFPIRTSRALI